LSCQANFGKSHKQFVLDILILDAKGALVEECGLADGTILLTGGRLLLDLMS